MILKTQKDTFFPKKRLGQNFLVNKGIQEKIVSAAQLSSSDTVLEIGPGKGALTKLIAPRVKKLVAVEKDTGLVTYLNKELEFSNVEIIQEDILKFPIKRVGANIKIIGNLPYNISTPIIESIIDQRAFCNAFYFMVQKEYADRLTAQVNSKAYGSLSCFIQYFADVKILFRIKPGSFCPSPKVDSVFLKCVFYKREGPAKDKTHLFNLIQKAFQQRRKTLENALGDHVNKGLLRGVATDIKIDLKKRAGEVSLAEFISLSNELKLLGV